MSREELELLEVPGNAFPPESLLPMGNFENNHEWEIEQSTVADFLRLEEITEGSMTGKVTSITDNQIKIELSGDIEGIAEGVSTQIEIKGNLHFNRDQKFVDWIAFALREKREVGFAAPGFEVVARIRSARQSIESSPALPANLPKLSTPTPDKLQLEHLAKTPKYEVVLDRRWYSFQQTTQSTVFRLIDDGDLLATCKIDPLNRMPAGKQITLMGFEADVRSALANNCKQIISVSEDVGPQGLRVLRVVAGGEVQKTPIRWVYYHLSNDLGHRLSVIFTYEASLESRLSGADRALVDGIQIQQQKQDVANGATATTR